MRAASLFFALLLLAACTTTNVASSGVRLTADRTAPDTVRLTLSNGSQTTIGYNLCSSTLERRTGTAWEDVQTDEVCTRELRNLNPGESATFDKRLPANLAAGEYRYVTTVQVENASAILSTQPFTP